MPNPKILSDLLKAAGKLPKGSPAAREAVGAKIAAEEAEQAARYAPHTPPTETGRKALAKAKQTLMTPEQQAKMEAELREKGKQKFLNKSAVKQRLYHGTNQDIKEFDPKYMGKNDFGWYGPGHYLTADPATASAYADYEKVRTTGKLQSEPSEGANVLPVHAQLKNPYYWPENRPIAKTPEEAAEIGKELRDQGYDGIIVSNKYQSPEYATHHEVIVFDPKRIKSATGNIGTYDITTPDITKKDGGLAMATGGQAFPLQGFGEVSETMFAPKPLQIPQELTDLATALRMQATKERRSLRKPGALTDILMRGPVAFAMGAPADIAEIGANVIDYFQTKIPGMRKPASVMDTGPERVPPMGYAPRFPLSPEGEMPFGTAHAQSLMKKAGMTTGEERPLTELAAGLTAPFAAPELVRQGKAAVRALAPTAKELVESSLEKTMAPARMYAVPEDGAKLSKEEYSRMMREKYAAQNLAKEQKKVTAADLKPQEVKVPADDLGFYSPAEKAAANLKRNIGTGEAFLQDIKKAPDVSPDELEFTGLERWLKGKKTVSKQEIQDYMNKNRLVLEEVEYKQGTGDVDEMRFPREGDVIDDYEYVQSRADDIAYDWDSYGYKPRDEIREEILARYTPEEAEPLINSGQIDEMVDEAVNDLAYQQASDEYYENPYRRWRNDTGYEIFGNDDVGYQIQDPRGRDITPGRGIYDFETAEGEARQHAMDYGFIDEGETKYHDYQLPGGSNYRELLIKSPGNEKDILREELRRLDDALANETDLKERVELQKELDRVSEKFERLPELYESSHWDEPNVLAHVRLQDRVDSEGNKILYVDEMQSDWHQEGRRYGYKTKEINKKMQEALEKRNQKQAEIDSIWRTRQERNSQLAKEFADSTDESIKAMGSKAFAEQDKLLNELDEAYNKGARELTKLQEEYGKYKDMVPAGPFTDNWHKMALKRVMKYAADNGYTRVGFSKAQPQVNRWGTDVVAWEKAPEGGWRVTATEQRGGRAGNINLEDDARARGILQESRHQTIDNRNDLYATVAKIGRGKSEAELQKLTDRIWKQMQEKDAGIVAPREAGMKKFYDEELEGTLKKYANTYKGKYGQTTLNVPGEGRQTINYIDITPDVKKSATKGQPYKTGGAVRMADGGAVHPAVEKFAASLPHPAVNDFMQRIANGGAAYNTIPDVSDAEKTIQGPAF